MNDQIEKADEFAEPSDEQAGGFDYAVVKGTARIACYDDLRSAPRITEIHPAPTADFIEKLASSTYEQAKTAGGTIPYTVVREVSENFIHARFTEIIVSILDGGNTIRFADQGPGIPQKEKAQLPGFTSAVEPMKRYIRGVGSGLPIVKEYLDLSHGTITIEDNLGTGAVVTISMTPTYGEAEYDRHGARSDGAPHFPAGRHADPDADVLRSRPTAERAGKRQRAGTPAPMDGIYAELGRSNAPSSLVPPLNQRERDFLPIFLSEGALGVTDLSRLTDVAPSSTYVTLSKLEQAGLIEKTAGQKRILTELGYQVAISL